jgi:ribosomal protein S18 acetylase RimI-like enzyme
VSELRFRVATRADDAFFLHVEFETTWHSLDEEERRRLRPQDVRDALGATHELLLARDGNQVFVAENAAGERVGLLWLGLNRNLVSGEEEAWVFNVSVVPEHQRKGVGREMMEYAERLARKQGFRVLGLLVSCHNEPARALYEKLGFRPTNIMMRKDL